MPVLSSANNVSLMLVTALNSIIEAITKCNVSKSIVLMLFNFPMNTTDLPNPFTIWSKQAKSEMPLEQHDSWTNAVKY
jgi:hypothetical protein